MNPWLDTLNRLWDELAETAPASRQYRSKQISSDVSLDFLAAIRATDEAPCLLLKSTPSSEALFELGGMRLSTVSDNSGMFLVLSLEDASKRDLFTTVCADVVAVATSANSLEARDQFLMRLNAWRQFLRERHSGLSREETIGLLGELIVLENLVARAPNVHTTWESPDDGLHDFHNCGHSLEVKTSLGPSSRVRISSVDQLATEGLDRLDLLHVRLTESPNGRAIETLLADIMPQLPNDNSRRALDNALLRRGLMPDDNTARTQPRVQLRSLDCYLVDGQFPRIVRSDLPAGVIDANYVVDLQAIAACGRDPELVLESFCGRAAA